VLQPPPPLKANAHPSFGMMAGVEGEHPDYRAKSVQDHNQENMMMEKEL
jgi:hypothetical protein